MGSDPDAAYALASVAERDRRTALLSERHMQPLAEHLLCVRAAVGGEQAIPAFDPLDGGIRARVLFLLEAPGPKAIASGFVSRNNPDPTARNLCVLLSGSGICRRDTLLWNIVPWYVGDGKGNIRPVSPADIRDALPHLAALLGLLPRLEVIVLVGKKAQGAAPEIRRLTALPFIATCHPSARVFNVRPESRKGFEASLAAVARLLTPIPVNIEGKQMPLAKTFQQLSDEAKSRIKEVSTSDVETLLATRDSILVIDVREQDEFRAGHLSGALGVGRGILEYHIADIAPDPDQEIVLYCRGGNRSALAADSLQQMGYRNVVSMVGGYRIWNAEGRAETTEGEPITH